MARRCAACHNGKLEKPELNLEKYQTAEAALRDRDAWEKVVEKLRSGEMPPAGVPRPPAADVQAVSRWIRTEIERLDRSRPPDPAEDFPADDEGYGFDNIGDVLSLSPVLMEKYLAAAEKIARRAVVADPPLQPMIERYKSDQFGQAGGLRVKHRFPVDGDYELRVTMGGLRPDPAAMVQVALLLDGRRLQVFEVAPETSMANLYLAMLDRMGVPAETLGHSNGELDYLTDLTG